MTALTTLGNLVLEPAGFTQPKPLVLLAYLALEGPQQRRHLAELFWPAGQSLKSLAMALSRLHKAAPHCWEADGTRLRCAVECDAVTLLAALDAGDIGLAIDLYRGPFLADLTPSQVGEELGDWLIATRARLADRYRTSLLAAAERSAADGDLESAADLRALTLGLTGAPAAGYLVDSVAKRSSPADPDEDPATDWDAAWALLEHGQREAAAGLAVFAGGFRRDAAEAAAQVGLRMLNSLLDSAWLLASATGRLRLRDELAGFASRRLDDSPRAAAVRTRHAHWFAELARRAEAQGRGPDQAALAAQVVEEQGNLLEALDHFAAHDAQRGLALAVDLAPTWSRRGMALEASSQLQRFLGLSQVEGTTRSWARLRLAQVAAQLGDETAAEPTYCALIEEAVSAGDGALRTEALLGLSRARCRRASWAEALELADTALRLARETGEEALERDALIEAGRLLTTAGDIGGALIRLERAVVASQSAGDLRAEAEASLGLSSAMSALGEPGRARWLAERGLELFTLLGDVRGVGEASALLNASGP